MAVVEDLSEEERYLLALMLDASGIDLAEFLWKDETTHDGVFRCFDFQYPWYRCNDKFQIDQAARSVGKTLGIIMRSFAFPFHSPGEEMLLTAPEMIHLNPITEKVADKILETRVSFEMLKKRGASNGITHRPFEAKFVNGARIIGRIPQKDGKGVKGCMVRGTMVLTRRGHVPIEEVVVGDQVLTHRGHWKPVIDTFRYVDADGVTVSGAGHRGLQMSESHRMLGRRNRNPQRTRNLERPEWVGAYDEELDERYYLGSPSILPQEPLPDFPHVDHEAVLALAGAYVADGCLPRPTTVSIMDDRDDTQRIAGLMEAVGLSVGAYPREGSRAVRVDGDGAARLVAFLREHFGEYANGKRLPVWLFGAEERLRKAFLNEYLAGDGHRDESKRRWQAGTASKALAIDLRLLAQTLGYAAAYSWVDPKPNAMSASPQRSHRVTISESARNIVAEGGVMWRKVVNVERATGLEVYDLNVKDDHSYLADGLWSHNQHPKVLEQDECFPAGTLVLTKRGQVPIEQVEVGDEAFTHEGRWRRVTDTMVRERETVVVEGHGHPGLICSTNHKFWVRGVTGRGDKRRDGHQGRLYGDPHMVAAVDLAPAIKASGNVKLGIGEHYWASPTAFPEDKPAPLADGRRQDEAFFRMVGMWVADGCTNDDQVIISDGVHEIAGVEAACNAAGVNPSLYPTTAAFNAAWSDRILAEWLGEHFGNLAPNKTLPAWALGMHETLRRALLEGYIYGDGFMDPDKRYAEGRWKAATVSKRLAIQVKLLAQTLGYSVNLYLNPAVKQKQMPGGAYDCLPWYQIVGNVAANQSRGGTMEMDGHRYGKVRTVRPTGRTETLYDLTVEGDHTFLVESYVVSNSQDYPEPGWVELGETLKYGNQDAIWRAHGVSRGVRDRFYKQTQEGSGWTVHRITAMHRGDWGPQERESKAELYGSRDHPDYRRNILGKHGDAQSALFVLTRLMNCVDSVQSSDYNEHEYYYARITDEKLSDSGLPIEAMLRLPDRHKSYGVTWAGIDIGLTNDPSEILVFGETHKARSSRPDPDESILKLLTRIRLERISAPNHRKIMEQVYDHYRPRVFAMDGTGLGLPIYQEIQNSGKSGFQKAVRSFNFSEKIVVGYETEEQDAERWWEDDEPDEVLANVLEYCVDDQTEALTKDGWKRHGELRAGDEVWGIDPETWVAGWTPVHAVHRFEGSRQMLSLESRVHSSLTTGSHRWLTERYDGHRREIKREWRTSDNLVQGSRIPLAVPSGDSPVALHSDALVELVAWFWTEGCHHWGRRDWCGASLGQSRKVNPGHVDRIEACLRAEFGAPARSRESGLWYATEREGMVEFHLSEKVASILRRFTSAPEKVVDPRFLAQLTQAQRLLFIETSLAADGTDDGVRRTLVQSSEARIRSFEMVCVLAGIPVNTHQLSNGMWSCALLKRARCRPLFSQSEGSVAQWVEYEGVVWCPQTDTGTWLARRNGTIYYTGNSTDMLRLLVDTSRITLPWDVELLREFQGQTYQISKSTQNPYGRKIFSKGSYHALDAARMAVLGFFTEQVAPYQEKQWEPVFDSFLA